MYCTNGAFKIKTSLVFATDLVLADGENRQYKMHTFGKVHIKNCLEMFSLLKQVHS